MAAGTLSRSIVAPLVDRLVSQLDPNGKKNTRVARKTLQGWQQYMRERRREVTEEVAKRWKEHMVEWRRENPNETKEPKNTAGFRCQVSKSLFDALPQEEQDAMRERAKEERAILQEAIAKTNDEDDCITNEERQAYVKSVDYIACTHSSKLIVFLGVSMPLGHL